MEADVLTTVRPDGPFCPALLLLILPLSFNLSFASRESECLSVPASYSLNR
jgi:hypothetical protein